jgi:hypothetical protein
LLIFFKKLKGDGESLSTNLNFFSKILMIKKVLNTSLKMVYFFKIVIGD